LVGSIVAKDIAPDEVAGENPAHALRKRFDEAIIKRLLEMRFMNCRKINLNGCGRL